MQTPNVRDHRLPDWRQAILVGLDIALLISLPILGAAWFYNPIKVVWGPFYFSARWGAKPILAPVLLLAARLAWRRHLRRRSADVRGPADSHLYKNTCLALLAPFMVLLAIEFAARLAGVKTSTYAPIVITGEERLDTTTDKANRIVKDPELLFAFNPGITWDGYPINSHGFRTWEFSAEKPNGTIRLIALGDSCTAQGHPPYSDRLNILLKKSPPTDNPWESFNTGVYGYSLMQGYRQFLKYGQKFKPDIVTIYFGWNDHWL
ncbi:MAG: SGNH/GDSL hydrolase family protein, partial [Kiritimatiellaeota bacterium]|nr:SGNH/GDSL hydrolase family protein [Kiritimatiellota bacterium]